MLMQNLGNMYVLSAGERLVAPIYDHASGLWPTQEISGPCIVRVEQQALIDDNGLQEISIQVSENGPIIGRVYIRATSFEGVVITEPVI